MPSLSFLRIETKRALSGWKMSAGKRHSGLGLSKGEALCRWEPGLRRGGERTRIFLYRTGAAYAGEHLPCTGLKTYAALCEAAERKCPKQEISN